MYISVIFSRKIEEKKRKEKLVTETLINKVKENHVHVKYVPKKGRTVAHTKEEEEEEEK